MTIWWVLGALGVAALGFLGIRAAIAWNGPAVLDAVDRITAPTVRTKRSAHSYGHHPSQRLYVHRASGQKGGERLPTIVFIHGGSWQNGDPRYYDFVGRAFAPRGAIVVNIGYRLGEEGKYPAMLQDSARALAWVHRNIADFGGNPSRIVLIGHSAGAYNAAMLALEKRWLQSAGVPPEAIAGVVGLAGPYDFYPFDSPSTIAAFGHATSPRETQPVNHANGEAPPFLLIHGKADTTVKPRHSRALEQALASKGARVEAVFYPDWDHNDPLLALASPWRARRDVVARIEALIAAETRASSLPVQPGAR